MSRSDLDAVAARRAAVARELVELKVARAALDAEDQELAVTERVLRRLVDLLLHNAPLVPTSNDATEGPKRIRTVEAFWDAISGRSGVQYKPLLTRIRDVSSRLFS